MTYREILAGITDGGRMVGEVKRRTRTGMSLCQGKTYGLLVRLILAEQLDQLLSEIQPVTQRPPVRPLPIVILAKPEGTFDISLSDDGR